MEETALRGQNYSKTGTMMTEKIQSQFFVGKKPVDQKQVPVALLVFHEKGEQIPFDLHIHRENGIDPDFGGHVVNIREAGTSSVVGDAKIGNPLLVDQAADAAKREAAAKEGVAGIYVEGEVRHQKNYNGIRRGINPFLLFFEALFDAIRPRKSNPNRVDAIRLRVQKFKKTSYKIDESLQSLHGISNPCIGKTACLRFKGKGFRDRGRGDGGWENHPVEKAFLARLRREEGIG